MIIAIFAEKDMASTLSAGLEKRGHACIVALDTIPGEADCVISVGGAAESLVSAAEEAGLPVLRLNLEGGLDAALDAAAWGLTLADERYIDVARSDARVRRLEDIRIKMAEQRALELASANELLQAQAADLKLAMEELDSANRQLVDELNLASELQKSLLPKSYPKDAPLEFAHKFIPLNSIGGDFFDVLRLDERSLIMVIADVSGHGVGPALVTALFKSAFGLEARARRSVADLMRSLNEEMGASLSSGNYVTSFAAALDLETLELRYCSAGHPKQLLLRADGSHEELSTMGFFLGMMASVEYEEKSLILAPGDTLVLFTDGVFEAANAGGEAFGREGILRSLAARQGQSPGELSDGVLEDLLAWTQGTEANDDTTLLLAQVLESL